MTVMIDEVDEDLNKRVFCMMLGRHQKPRGLTYRERVNQTAFGILPNRWIATYIVPPILGGESGVFDNLCVIPSNRVEEYTRYINHIDSARHFDDNDKPYLKANIGRHYEGYTNNDI